jgi:phospholipid N-methyltransferase
MNIPWKLKSFVFKALDIANAPKILYFLQKYVTKRSRISSVIISDDWVRHAASIKKYNAGGLVFEFGGGKTLAQNLYLSNLVNRQIVVDLNPMLDLTLVNTARSLLATQCALKSDHEIATTSDLAHYGIEYRAPYDASDTDFDNQSIDACISTNTLEHIPKASIIKILDELQRVLKADGIISAKIDYSDHYAHTDSSISLLNYLNFSEAEWKKHNHKCHYQNRLRHYDYVELFETCGFKIMEEDLIYGEAQIPQEIAEKFASHPRTWAATSAYFVLMKK